MERRINTKIETYIGDLKTKICDKINEKTSLLANEDRSELLQYVYDFERLILVKDDFIKRKRHEDAELEDVIKRIGMSDAPKLDPYFSIQRVSDGYMMGTKKVTFDAENIYIDNEKY